MASTVLRQVDQQIRLFPRIRTCQTGASNPKLIKTKVRCLTGKLVPKRQDLP